MSYKSVNFAKNKSMVELENKHKNVPTWVKVIISLLAMVAIGFVLIWLAAQCLSVWTRHGQETLVPSVKGMSVFTAEEILDKAGFTVVVSDSVYISDARPGVVMEQSPKANSKVKDGCTVYLSINAFTPRQIQLPALTDISYRQAKSILDGLGIKNVRVDTVPSDFKDLVLAVKRDGKRLMPGARVPVDAKLVIEIGQGIPEEILNNQMDSLAIDTAFTAEKLNLF